MANRRDPDRPVTRADFVGAKMSNFLYALADDKRLDENTRAEARLLCEQWDSVSPVRINNPITAAELEKATAAGELK